MQCSDQPPVCNQVPPQRSSEHNYLKLQSDCPPSSHLYQYGRKPLAGGYYIPFNLRSLKPDNEDGTPLDPTTGYYRLPPCIDKSQNGNCQGDSEDANKTLSSDITEVEIRNLEKPAPSYMCLSVLNCLCCSWILGIVAIHYSQKTEEANSRSKYKEYINRVLVTTGRCELVKPYLVRSGCIIGRTKVNFK